MKGRNRERTVTLLFALLIVLIPLLSPLTTELTKGQTDDKITFSFDPRSNEPPSTPINSYPPNSSTDIESPTSLQILVCDQSSAFVDVYFYNASNNSLIGVDYNVSVDFGCTIASTIWTDTQKGKIYRWYTVVNDSEYETTSETWIFATRPNQPSIIHNNEYPQNTSANIEINTTCHIEVSDEDADLMTIYWYENSTGSWILRQTNSSVQNGTYYWTFLQATNYFTTYYWKAVVNDSIHNTTAIFHFTTIPNQPLTISSPSPANQSIDVSIATPYWQVTIEDPENDTINWTIENSPNVGSTSGNNDINGQKSCPLSGLQYNTTYTVYVNATDAGNGSWVNETFWFTTSEEYAPTISNEYPPNRNTYIDLQPTCHVDVHDIEGDNLTIYWYENSTGSWVLLQTDSNVSANSTVYWTFSQASSYSTTHYWKVVVDDGTYNTTAIYHFTTKPKPSAPSPGGGGSSGYTPLPNRHPIANITGLHTGYINETLIFYAYYSYDPDGYITGYRWDFENDGVFDTDWLEDILITCHYSLPRNYTIRLQVKDDDGAITTTSHSIHIIQLEPPLQLPIPQINGPYYGYTHENVIFSSNGSYDPDGTIINYTWDFGDGNKSYLKNPVHSYAEPGNHTVTLKVTDDDNLNNITTTESIIIEPEERKLPLMFPLFLLLALIAALLVFIFIRHKGYRFTLFIEKLDKTTNNNVEEEIDELLFLSELEKNRHKTAEAEVETLLSELMKIMYSDDVDAKFATDQLGISSEKLKTLVDKLVKRGLLRYTSDNEVEITEQGIKYITI